MGIWEFSLVTQQVPKLHRETLPQTNKTNPIILMERLQAEMRITPKPRAI